MRLPPSRRRFDSVGSGPAKPGGSFNANVREMNRRRKWEMEDEKPLGVRHSRDAISEPEEARPSAEVAPRESRAPTKSAPAPRRRPDQHTEVTHEEAFATPWLDQTRPDPNPRPAPAPAPGFESWNPVIPSYDRPLEEGPEEGDEE